MSFRTERRVEFRDTDAAGIAHFSVFFPMMEEAEHQMLRSFGLSVMPKNSGSGEVTWPRVAASCDYQSVARFEDLLEISISVTKIGSSSVTYQFDFTRNGEKIAVGSMTAVCCTIGPEGLTKVPIPDEIRGHLAQHE